MDAIISLVGSIAPYAFAPIRREVGYLIHYERNFTKLNDCVSNLQASREDIDRRVKADERNGKTILDSVQKWLVDVDEVIERANQLLDHPRRREVGCSGWSFPNFILRHQLGRRATKIANDIAGFQGRKSDFNEVGYLPPLDEIASSSATHGGEKFETRKTFKEHILKALRDPKAGNIGIYGLGGMGKTFLVNEVADDIGKQQKLFDRVVIVPVSKTPDIKKIQWVIADVLGLKFEEESTEGRASRLMMRIKAEKSVLVILDDIWQPLELEKVGIPSNKEHIGCKLLMTSRTQDVLNKMGVEKDFTFRLEVLSDTETWSLFQSKAGDVVNDISLNSLATQVAKQCKGFPILIVTVASGLKIKDISVWKVALTQLQSVGHVEMEVIVHSALELSYNWLASEEIKALFLLSAVLGYIDSYEDYLLKVAMGLDIFKNIGDIVDDARNKLHSIIESLKASCLLIEGNNTSLDIKMHDLVHDVAISIACRDNHVYMLKPKAGLKNCLPKDFPKMCSQIILSNCLLHELPKKLECPDVKLFCLSSESRSLEIPDTIFDGMGSLKVLDLTFLNLSSLPTSFCSLTSLQTLCLEHCVLENIDITGDLKNLEILSLLNSSMINLPSNIREMTKLRMLDLSNSGIEVIPPNIISSLSNLEELYMGNISIKWEDENSVEQKENDILAELQPLYNLTTLELQIHKARPLPYLNSMFEKLQRYKIAIGDVWEWSDIEHTTLNTLMLKLDTSIQSELEIKALIKGVENLYMDEVYGIQNVLYEMNGEGFPLLRHLHIQNNAKMKHIVDSTERNQAHASFPKLETLLINNLEKLMQICHGPLAINSFGKLSVIKVKNCAKLTYLLSVSMVKRLSNLSEIEVCQCNSMENIVLGDVPDEKVEFSSLRSLTLQQLDKLDNYFCSELKTSSITSTRPFFSSQVAFPKLETLKLSSLNLNKIWDENQHSMYNKLTILIVENCGELKYLFSSTMVQSFVNLTRLEISNCNLMNEIIAQTALNVVW
ncbi:putative disease resistance protein [Trifolium repens]|nr:putative disease resistance protein [Trifolium repens]